MSVIFTSTANLPPPPLEDGRWLTSYLLQEKLPFLSNQDEYEKKFFINSWQVVLFYDLIREVVNSL